MASKKRPEPAKTTGKPADAPIKQTPPAAAPATEQKDLFTQLGNKAVWVALGVLILISFIIYKNFLFGENVYYYKDIASDSYNCSYPFLREVARYIGEHGVPKWSFNFGMGQSLFPFFLRDPFDLLLYIGGKNNVVYGMMLKELTKVIGGGIVFYYYLKTMNVSSYTSIVGSMMYAFCGFNIVAGNWFIFSFESFNMAVILLAFEQLYLKNKWYLFPFAILLLCISQPFNLYVYGLFLTGYAILRLLQTGGFNIKTGGGLFLRMIGFGVLGMVLSGPFLLENLVQLLESPRGSGTNSYASVLSSVPPFTTVDKFLLGTSVMRLFSSEMMGTGNAFRGWQNMLEAPLFYCGLPCLLLMPQVFPLMDKKKRIAFIVFMAMWLMPIVFPYFRYAFWLFTGDYFRAYSIVIAFFFIYYSVLALDMILEQRKVSLPVLIGTVAVLFLLLNYPFLPDKEFISSPVFTFVSFMVLVYAALLFFMGRPGSPVYLKYIFFVALAFELMYLSGIGVNDRDPVTKTELTEKKGYNDHTIDAVKYINAQDHSFFRIDKMYASSPAIHYSLNDGMAQEYRGTSQYWPFNQMYYVRYLQLMGISNRADEHESRWARGLSARPILESGNRVKYMLAKGQQGNPLWRVVGDSIATFGDVTVFKNKYLMPIGYTYNYYIKESVFDALSITQKDLISLKACVVRDEDVSKVAGMKEFQLRDTVAPNAFNMDIYRQGVTDLSKDSMVVSKFDDTHIAGTINASQDEMMYMALPYDGGWTLKMDGKEKDKSILFAGMTGVMLPKGQHTIEMTYELRYFNKGLLMMVLGLLAYGGLWFFTRNKKQGAATAN